jgi:DNA-binding PadR family transcriptional regulator
MSTRLVILGLLQQGKLHGYEIKNIITKHMDDWTSIAFGSIYFALKKLSEEGLIAKVGEEQSGNRPSRSIYEITKAGRNEFMALLRQLWAEPERTYFSFDVALFFISALSSSEACIYLYNRIAKLESSLQFLNTHKKEHRRIENVPKVAFAIMDHSIAHIKAEIKWLKDTVKKIETGEIT